MRQIGKTNLEYSEEQEAPGKDENAMVKGTTRQVILVKSPDPKLFEQAIFLVKEEAMNGEGITTEQVIREARQAADGYLKSTRRSEGKRGLPGPLWAAAGALLTCAVWGLGLLLL